MQCVALDTSKQTACVDRAVRLIPCGPLTHFLAPTPGGECARTTFNHCKRPLLGLDIALIIIISTVGSRDGSSCACQGSQSRMNEFWVSNMRYFCPGVSRELRCGLVDIIVLVLPVDGMFCPY